MFNRKNDTTINLDIATAQALEELSAHDVTSAEFTAGLTNVEKLFKFKSQQDESKISPDVMVTAAANLAGIVMILQHERAHVVASKAMSFVMKLR